MASTGWRGDAQAVAQVSRITPGSVTSGDTFTVTVNRKEVTFIATAATVGNVTAGLAAALAVVGPSGTSAAQIPEFAEFTPSDQSTYVQLTGVTKGVPFTVATTDSGTSTVSDSTPTEATGPNHYSDADNWSGGAAPTSGVNEVQTLTITGTPTGGTFTITFSGQTTGVIAYNASAADVQTALEGLSNIDVGDVTCGGGALPGSAVTITFGGQYRYQNVALATTTDSLTGGTSPESAIATTTAGVTGDDVYLENNNVDILYGLSQSAVILNSFNALASYTGLIGLPEKNEDYYEYRPTYLAIGATTVNVGQGEGNGSPRIKLDTGSVQTAVNVYRTGVTTDTAQGAFIWKGTHASNVMRVYRGSVAIAPIVGETATLATLTVGYVDNQSSDARVYVGPGVTISTLNVFGGIVEIDSGATITTINQQGGQLVIRGSGGVTTASLSGGTLDYRSTGTIATLNAATSSTRDTTVTFERNPGCTVTTCNVYGAAKISDPFKSVTFTNGVDCEQSDMSNLNLGVNLKVSRASVT